MTRSDSIGVLTLCLLGMTGCGLVGFDEATSTSSSWFDNNDPGTCDDRRLNNHETQIDCGGPNCPACIESTVTSCKALLAKAPDSQPGMYAIDIDGPGPEPGFNAYCEMIADGGGWTLAMKLDGTKRTFDYESILWVSTDTYQAEQASMAATETKLASFYLLPAKEVRIGMLYNGVTQWRVLTPNLDPPQTLRQIFAADAYVATSLGRQSWLSMIAGADIQPFCNQEGFNLKFSDPVRQTKARLGILGNDDTPDCATPDSFVGYGAANPRADAAAAEIFTISTGNGWAFNATTSTIINTAAFGYIMVRE